MIVKKILIIMLSLLWGISFIQIFSIPPYSGDIVKIYKSGYFKELERNMFLITDSFLQIKTMSKAEYAWIYLNDISTKYNIIINVYNSEGRLVKAPGMSQIGNDTKVIPLLHELKPEAKFFITGDSYCGIIPVYRKSECNFCHQVSQQPLIGIITYSMPYDGYIYYTSERIIIFVIITFAISCLLFVVIRWQPYKDIQELFDK